MMGLRGFTEEILGKAVYTIENMNFKNVEFANSLDKDKMRYLVNAVGLAM